MAVPPFGPHVAKAEWLPMMPLEIAPNVPSVRIAKPPALSWLKLPGPTLLGKSPAIRLPPAHIQVGAKTPLPAPVWLAAEIIMLLLAAGRGLTVNTLALLAVTPDALDACRL